jgi:membrane protein implicated in regulation of membrane protease activity
MTLADFYLFCFAFGFLFSAVTVITGHLHLDIGHGHGHGHDFGLHHHGNGGHTHGGPHDVSPFNFGTVSAFLAWFGGTGYLATTFYRLWFVSVLLAAIAAGVFGGWLVYLFLTRVLMRSREELDPADYDMVGVLGRVSGNIRAGGIGEILYSRDGARRAVAAMSEEGSAIAAGEEVVVTRYENGIAWVRRWNDLIG